MVAVGFLTATLKKCFFYGLKLKTIRDDTSRLTLPTFDFSRARRAALSKP